MTSLQSWIQLSVFIFSAIPLYYLLKSYYRTRMLDYLLFSGVFISAAIALLFDFIRNSTDSKHVIYAQLIDSSHLLIYLFLFLHASRIKSSSINKIGLTLIILQMMIIQISVLLYKLQDLTDPWSIFFFKINPDRGITGESFAYVISDDIVIMGENFRFLLFVFRLPIQIFFLYVYFSVKATRETNRIKLGKKIMNAATLMLVLNTISHIGHSMGFWTQPFLLGDAFNLITFVLLAIVFIQYPETILTSHVQINRAVQVLPATTELLEYQVLLHPVRLTIIKILHDNNSMLSSDLRNMLGISWGKFSQHVKNLVDNGLIISKREFIDNSPQNRLYLEERGRTHFFELQDLILKIFSGR